MTNFTTIVGVISTTIVAILGIIRAFKAIDKKSKKIVSWKFVEKGIENLLSKMRKDNYYPEAIFSIGRGGAVISGLISNKFYREKKIPIFMVDRDIIHSSHTRKVVIRKDILDIKKSPNNILLVSGINASGSTYEKYFSWLNSKGVTNIRSCVLVESIVSKNRADYVYERTELDPTKLNMPWYKGGIIDWQPPSYNS